MIDPELAAMVDLLPKMDLADPVAARRAFEEILVAIRIDIPGIETLDIEDRMVPGREDDPDVPVRLYRPKGASAAGAGARHRDDPRGRLRDRQRRGRARRRGPSAIGTGAVVVSVDYRLAPEHPYPAGLHDCYAALRYLHAEADALGVDPERVALTGASAGGGLSAATALFARDRGGPAVCFQLLAIPELDDRLQTPSMQTFVDSPLWNRPLAVQSWQAYLGPLYGSDDVPAYAAPARSEDLSGLPPAYISTAENDPLRDEGITYAQRLLQAGVSVELHQFPGTFHGSALVTSAAVSKRAQRESALVLRQALGVEPD